MIAVIAVALAGGLVPAVFEAIAGSPLVASGLLPPVRTVTDVTASGAAALGVLMTVAVAVSLLARKAARHAVQVRIMASFWPPPMSPWICSPSWSPACWTFAGLQAGALPVYPRPADLAEIVVRSLDTIGPQARGARVSVPRELPRVMVDPVIMERVIANVTANALRSSPGGSPPQLTACARADRVELPIIDHGPGVPEADRDRIFVPFQRLEGTDDAVGVGLGLTVSRGLTEAMRGTLEPGKLLAAA